jgi:hypothetical protein
LASIYFIIDLSNSFADIANAVQELVNKDLPILTMSSIRDALMPLGRAYRKGSPLINTSFSLRGELVMESGKRF